MDRWWTYSGSLTRDVLSPSPVRSVKPTSPQEEANRGPNFTQEPEGHSSALNPSTSAQGRSEKYGSWMLVSRKERRNRYSNTHYRNVGPGMERTQAPRGNQTAEGLVTQSRFAALDNLDDAAMIVDQENLEVSPSLRQSANSLPRIRTRDHDKHRSPLQREAGPSRAPRDFVDGQQSQPHQRGGYQNAIRSGYQNANRSGYQNTYRGGYQSAHRGGFRHAEGGSRGQNPPDRGGSSANEFNFPDVAMMEDLDQFDPSAGVADGHMRS
nr:NFX1-type zinc finger-containing protein 1-like [Ipomoea batatas]